MEAPPGGRCQSSRMRGNMGAIDVLILICGGYILYQTILMKKDRHIPEGIFISKGTYISVKADIDGYIAYIFPKAIILGVLGAASGGGGLLREQYPEYSLPVTLISICFLVWLIIFMGLLRKAGKKYLEPK